MESKNQAASRERINFQHLRKNGRRTQLNPWLLVYWDLNTTKKSRILWSLSRKVSNAVVRNKLKRWCREFIRLSPAMTSHGLDLNIVFKPQKKDFYKDLRRDELDTEFKKLEKRVKSYLESL